MDNERQKSNFKLSHICGVLVQEVSSDLKTPDSELDSGKIDPKKELENKGVLACPKGFIGPKTAGFGRHFR